MQSSSCHHPNTIAKHFHFWLGPLLVHAAPPPEKMSIVSISLLHTCRLPLWQVPSRAGAAVRPLPRKALCCSRCAAEEPATVLAAIIAAPAIPAPGVICSGGCTRALGATTEQVWIKVQESSGLCGHEDQHGDTSPVTK